MLFFCFGLTQFIEKSENETAGTFQLVCNDPGEAFGSCLNFVFN